MTANRNLYEDWIPEEWDSNVIQRVQQMSAVERHGRHYPMATDTRHVPRSAGIEVSGVAKGDNYTPDESLNDEVLLVARKFGRAVKIAEEDLVDSNVNILDQKRIDWATSYGKFFDNATLGVTAAVANGTTVPFVSVYAALRQSNVDTDYTADDNYTATTSAGVTYDDLSEVLGLYEVGDYFDLEKTVVIAHPAFREKLRGVKDLEGMPVFVRGQGADRGTPDTLFNIPITWSLGAKTSATAMQSPDGNPLLIVCNSDFLAVGDRSGPESKVAGQDALFLSDEALLKMRARRGFAVAHEKAFSVLELTV